MWTEGTRRECERIPSPLSLVLPQSTACERLAIHSFSSSFVEHATLAFALSPRPAFPCLLYPCLDVPRPRSVPGGRPPSFWQAACACWSREHYPPRSQCPELRIQHQHHPRRQGDPRASRYRKVCDAQDELNRLTNCFDSSDLWVTGTVPNAEDVGTALSLAYAVGTAKGMSPVSLHLCRSVRTSLPQTVQCGDTPST